MPTRQIQKFHNIKGILLDLDGTLYHQTPLRAIMMFQLVLLNFFQPRELRRNVRVILQYRKSQEALRYASKGKIGNRENQLELTASNTGETVSYISGIVEEWLEKRPIPFLRFCRRGKLRKTIGFLSEKGFRLGVFSDYPAEEKLEALGISKFITTVVSSHDREILGFKPKTNGFEIAAAKMGLTPSEILYVGDRPEIDAPGASDAGMSVAIIKRFQKNRPGREYRAVRSFSDLPQTII